MPDKAEILIEVPTEGCEGCAWSVLGCCSIWQCGGDGPVEACIQARKAAAMTVSMWKYQGLDHQLADAKDTIEGLRKELADEYDARKLAEARIEKAREAMEAFEDEHEAVTRALAALTEEGKKDA